jgi:SAM-dependent methyltransferase
MRDEMYDQHYAVQKDHWWFVVKEKIVMDVIERFCPRSSDRHILDAGCGPGLMLEGLKGLGHIYGMDFSDKAVQYSRGKKIGDIRQGDLPNHFPFTNLKFDLILALDLIEHIDEDVESLRVLRNALKPNGKLIITVPAFPFLWSKHDDMNQHKRRYTRVELTKKLELASLRIEQITYYNTFLFLPVLFIRAVQRIFKIESYSDLKVPSTRINNALKFVFGLERGLLKRGGRFPFGVSLMSVASPEI